MGLWNNFDNHEQRLHNPKKTNEPISKDFEVAKQRIKEKLWITDTPHTKSMR